jgi:hypothetical protein
MCLGSSWDALSFRGGGCWARLLALLEAGAIWFSRSTWVCRLLR